MSGEEVSPLNQSPDMLLCVTSNSGKSLTLIMLSHMRMMPIVVSPGSCALIGSSNVPSPEEKAVSNQGADLENA